MREAVGFAEYLRQALPNATFVGFTGTPIEEKDRNTQAVFGDVIDTYDMTQAVAGQGHRADPLHGPAGEAAAGADGRGAPGTRHSGRGAVRGRRRRRRAGEGQAQPVSRRRWARPIGWTPSPPTS